VVRADEVVLNSDFGYSMTHLAEPGTLRKWHGRKLEKARLSCSTFMLYLGLKQRYEFPHHNIVFAEDYRRNVEEVFERQTLSADMSFYVQNATPTDPSLAPEGKSTIYVLVPVPNLRTGIDWDRESGPMRERVLDVLARRTELGDVRDQIEVEKVITPVDWEQEYHVYEGATFNLAHNLTQMLWFRPRNRFEEWGHSYLVGGGTHPGSGLPTIYESGRISANLICAASGVAFEPPTPLVAKEPVVARG
jgi:phytoene desaturase